MTDALMTETEIRQLGLLSSVLTDDGTKERIAALMKAQQGLEDAKAKLEIQTQANQQILRETEQRLQAALQQERHNQAYKDQLDNRERTMAEVQAGINAEKAAWEKVRQETDERQRQIEAALKDREDEAAKREKDAGDLNDSAMALHQEAANLEAMYRGMVADLLAVLERHGVKL